MPRDHVDVLIIGAGPTGLGAAWRLSALGEQNWCLCEAGGDFGGLAGSAVDGHGFTWDHGGHVQHSHYDYFDRLMDDLLGRDGWLHHQRASWIWVCGRFVPYPFQLNLHHLPANVCEECLDGLSTATTAPADGRPSDFGEWIDATFGKGIARVFMRPYNIKVWTCPPEDMDWRWIGDRVAVVDFERVHENVRRQRDDVSWGPNNEFRYPLRGGTGAVWRALGQRLDQAHPGSLLMEHRLARIDTTRHTAHFTNGQCIRYGRLVSSLPLDQLVRMSDQHAALEPAAAKLRYASTHVLGIGLHGSPGESLAGKCWMYFPEADFPFYRVTVFSHYSPFNVPDATRYWSLMAEVSESVGRTVSVESLTLRTVQGLINARLISREQVHHVWHRRLERGYPVPSLHRDSALGAILPALEACGVYSRGRFGAWRYEVSNQDHSFAQGVEVVDRWLSGAPEETLTSPHVVNARRPARRLTV